MPLSASALKVINLYMTQAAGLLLRDLQRDELPHQVGIHVLTAVVIETAILCDSAMQYV
jgi:hypothetical protein